MVLCAIPEESNLRHCRDLLGEEGCERDLKILEIKPVPKWKFWKTDNIEVIVKLDNGEIRKITIWDEMREVTELEKSLILDFVKRKIETGHQFPPHLKTGGMVKRLQDLKNKELGEVKE